MHFILDNLLVGKLISQGSSRSELVGAARSKGVGPNQIEEVEVRCIVITKLAIKYQILQKPFTVLMKYFSSSREPRLLKAQGNM